MKFNKQYNLKKIPTCFQDCLCLHIVYLYRVVPLLWGCHDHDRMIVRFTTTYPTSVYYH
jgi:hypothetical protein